MISSSTWVPRGFASEFPEKYEMNDEEMERISSLANMQLEDARADLEEAGGETKEFKDQIEIDDDLKEYDLENYDEVDSEGEQVTMFPGLSNTDAKFHQDETDGNDAFISLPNEQDLSEEKSELQVYASDNMVLATRTEDDVSYLDVYVYDDGAGAPEGSTEEEEDKFDADVAKGLVRESNLYVHHDLMLPAFPLCVEWVNFKPMGENAESNVGNFAAVGTFDPQIEIWNLDCIEKAFPDVILGEPEANSSAGLKSKKKKKKSKKAAEHVTTHHTDAILSLAHNRIHRSILASTSADATVKLWDLSSAVAARSMAQIHQGKHVSSSQWHVSEASILLTGGYDGCVALSDVRIADDSEMTKRWSVHAGEEVESIKWGSDASTFYAGTDAGNVYCFDARVADKPVWTLQAHDAGISALEVNPFVPGMVVTSAMGEKSVKLWKVPTSAADKTRPSMVLARDFGVGNVLTTSFAPDIEVAGNITIGGVTGLLKMWDMFSNRAVRSAFSTQLRDLQKQAREEAKRSGRASRLARKYTETYKEAVLTVEDGGEEESESEDEGQWESE